MRIGRWWRSGYGRQWAGLAALPRQGGASNERLSGAAWTRTLPWRVAVILGVGAAGGVYGSLLAPG